MSDWHLQHYIRLSFIIDLSSPAFVNKANSMFVYVAENWTYIIDINKKCVSVN